MTLADELRRVPQKNPRPSDRYFRVRLAEIRERKPTKPCHQRSGVSK